MELDNYHLKQHWLGGSKLDEEAELAREKKEAGLEPLTWREEWLLR